MTIAVASFYKFVAIDEPHVLRAELLGWLDARAMKGTILVAPEGINGTISGMPEMMHEVLALLRADPRFADLTTRDGVAAEHPFQRLKVRLKREIITLRRPEADPLRLVGTYVVPADWNALIRDPDVLVIDLRNIYEVEAGTFDRAVDPRLRHFGDWPAFVAEKLDAARDKKIAMFCTGGIRCEKASAYLLAHGFLDVYHLKGGILGYLAEVAPDASLWRGACFVFDERGGVEGPDAGESGMIGADMLDDAPTEKD